MLRANPDQMAQLKQNNPRLSEALESGDLEAFAKVTTFPSPGKHLIRPLQVLKEQQESRKEREQMRIRMMNADPFDMEAQRMIQQVECLLLAAAMSPLQEIVEHIAPEPRMSPEFRRLLRIRSKW